MDRRGEEGEKGLVKEGCGGGEQHWKSLGVAPQWNWACMLFFNRPVYFARWDIGAPHAARAVGSAG